MVNQLVVASSKEFYDFIAAYSQHLSHSFDKTDKRHSTCKYSSNDGVCRAEVVTKYKNRRFYINKGWSPHA